ncbi:MAG TPA: Mu-like prophage major head subunit gpT family protein [Methylocystis sp.]|jgi:phage major head subunit gpT-like protein
MIINHANVEFLNTAYRANFQRAFDGVSPMWTRFATEVPSSTKTNMYAWLGQFPKMREWIGDRQIKSVVAKGYEVPNKPFEATVSVPRDDIEDDQWNVYGPLMEAMGMSAGSFPDEEMFGLLNAGFTTLCYDGQNFFDTDHPVGIPGQTLVRSVSNYQAGTGPAWFLLDISRPIKPMIWQWRRKPQFISKVDPKNSDHVFMTKEFLYGVDLRAGKGFGFWQMAAASKADVTAANVIALYTAMTRLESDEGRKLGIKPQVMLCGPSTYFAARALIEAQIIGATTNTLYKIVEVVNVPWLD